MPQYATSVTGGFGGVRSDDVGPIPGCAGRITSPGGTAAMSAALTPRYAFASDNLKGGFGPTKREQRFIAAVEVELHEAAAANETHFSDRRKVHVCEKTWPRSIGTMRETQQKVTRSVKSYDAMMLHTTVKDALRAVFEKAGFSPLDAAGSLAKLASGQVKTVTTVVHEGLTENDPSYTETRTVEHPPDVNAIKAYYAMTHDLPVQRRENVNLNLDVMKEPVEALPVGPRAIGSLGPAESGHVNVFAEEPEPEEEDEDEDEPA